MMRTEEPCATRRLTAATIVLVLPVPGMPSIKV